MNLIQPINLVEGLNINPIPLEFSQSMTTTKWLLAIQAKVNTIVELVNGTGTVNNAYTDAKFDILNAEYNSLMVLLNSGNIIPDGSIDLKKLTSTFFTDLQEKAVEYVHNVAQFVTFGLDDTGRFIAYIPASWDEIVFSTSEIGELLLDLKED